MNTVKLLGMVGAVAMAAGGALGQDAPLKGPPVKQDRPAGLGGQFSEGKEDRKGPMTERVPMRIYAEAIDKLRGESAPEGLRLSEQQNLQIRQIEANFRNTMQEYVRRTREENAAKGKPAGQEADQMTEETRRARAQELVRNAPNPTDAQVKVYALLSPEQQKFVQAEVAKAQGEMEKRRSEEYAQRLLKKKQGDGAKPPEAQAPAAPDATLNLGPEGRERARRIIERLQQLPPEEREQILRRLEAELDRRATGGDGQRRRPPQGEGKVPPRIDDVKVPQPEKP
jgi:hypothetical protein